MMTRRLSRLLLSNLLDTSLNKSLSYRTFATTSVNKMRFVQFVKKYNGDSGTIPSISKCQRLGAQLAPGGDIYEISAINPSLPNSLLGLLKAGDEAIDQAKRIVGNAESVIPIDEVKLLAPIWNPDKVACVGLNYTGHCQEQNKTPPTEPMFFCKFPSVIIGPNDDIKLPTISNSVDYEVELAVIIGKKAKAVPINKAYDYVFGYTIAQDISARDWQKRRNNGQFLLGKSFDTFCPLGPAVITKECVNVDNLKISTAINGVVKQSGNTSELVFKVDFLVSYLSQIVTLYPGDVILTGTPAGVGEHRSPQEFLKSGDVITSEIEGIGKLVNTCV